MGNGSFLFFFQWYEIAALGCDTIRTEMRGLAEYATGNDQCLRVLCTRKNDGYQLLMGGKQDCCCIHHSLNQPHSVSIVLTSYRHHHNWWPKLLTRGFVYVSRVITALAPEAASFYIRHQRQFCLVLSPTATLIIIIITTQMLAEVHHDSWDSQYASSPASPSRSRIEDRCVCFSWDNVSTTPGSKPLHHGCQFSQVSVMKQISRTRTDERTVASRASPASH